MKIYKLQSLGNFESIPEIAIHIYEGNVQVLESMLAEGCDLLNGVKSNAYQEAY